MEPDIIRDMDKCYLVIEAEQGVKTGYQQKMVLHNDLQGLLRVEYRQVDENFKYYYDITNKVSLFELWKNNDVTEQKIELLFTSIIKIVQDVRSYLLCQDNFILSPHYIYLDSSDNAVFLCYYEAYQVDIRLQLVKLVEYLMEIMDYKEERAVTLTYRLYKELREESCNFQVIEDVVKSCSVGKKCAEEKYNEPSPKIPLLIPEEGMKERSEKTDKITINQTTRLIIYIIANLVYFALLYKTGFLVYENSSQICINHVVWAFIIWVGINLVICFETRKYSLTEPEDSPDWQYLNEEGTMVLPRCGPEYILKCQGDCGNILLYSFPFLLGSSRADADGAISSMGISKQHALIERVNGNIYIKDLHSTNGTFINGELINPMEQYGLTNGDKITLANLTYEFIKLS